MGSVPERATPTSAHAAGYLAGLLSGELFLLLGLLRHGADLMTMSPSASHTAWVLLNSLAIYGLLGGVAGAIAGIVFQAVFRLAGRGTSLVRARDLAG